MPRLRRVVAFHPDGSLTLEDGSEMQAVVSESGALGARAKVREDFTAQLDQHVGPPSEVRSEPPLPSIESLGLDQ
jgi:hypothetical protein